MVKHNLKTHVYFVNLKYSSLGVNELTTAQCKSQSQTDFCIAQFLAKKKVLQIYVYGILTKFFLFIEYK